MLRSHRLVMYFCSANINYIKLYLTTDCITAWTHSIPIIFQCHCFIQLVTNMSESSPECCSSANYTHQTNLLLTSHILVQFDGMLSTVLEMISLFNIVTALLQGWSSVTDSVVLQKFPSSNLFVISLSSSNRFIAAATTDVVLIYHLCYCCSPLYLIKPVDPSTHRWRFSIYNFTQKFMETCLKPDSDIQPLISFQPEYKGPGWWYTMLLSIIQF